MIGLKALLPLPRRSVSCSYMYVPADRPGSRDRFVAETCSSTQTSMVNRFEQDLSNDKLGANEINDISCSGSQYELALVLSV